MGSINEQEQASVTGIIIAIGLIPIDIAMALIMGRSIVLVATLLVNSDRMLATMQMITITRTQEADSRNSNESATHSVNPELSKPDASAKAPPSNNKVPHGAFWMAFLSSKASGLAASVGT